MEEILLPVSNVTSCAFGGENLDELYITTARHGLDEEQLINQPLAGGVFMAKPGIKGIPCCKFSG
jgi:sugar lactone lactonase YvrE